MYRTLGVVILIVAFVAAVALVSGCPKKPAPKEQGSTTVGSLPSQNDAVVPTALTALHTQQSPLTATPSAAFMPGVEGCIHSGAIEHPAPGTDEVAIGAGKHHDTSVGLHPVYTATKPSGAAGIAALC